MTMSPRRWKRLGMLVELAPELPQQRNTLEILPIHLACQAHVTECVQFLTKFPAVMTGPDDQGRTPCK